MNESHNTLKLAELLARLSYREGEFVLASGQKSNFYVDVKQTIMTPAGTRLTGELLWDRLRRIGIDSVGGMAVGAVPLVSAVLAAAAARGDDSASGFFVRKDVKGHGTSRKIDGRFDARATIGLVEDVVTTGESTILAIDAVEAAGGRVSAVVSVVDREENDGLANLASRVPVVEALVTRTLILEAAARAR